MSWSGLLNGAAQAEAGNHFAVAVDVLAGQVVEQSAPAAYHFEETPARVVVVLMLGEMPPELIDTRGEDCYLYFGRTRISLVNPVVPDNFLLAFGLQSQIV
jgi:hypothetical protein